MYAIERGLSLRLGRASAIHDCDITLNNSFSDLPFPEPLPEMLSFWVGNARIQGKFYKGLYSKAALLKPESSLSAYAQHLMEELQSVGVRNSHVRCLIHPLLPSFTRFDHIGFSFFFFLKKKKRESQGIKRNQKRKEIERLTSGNQALNACPPGSLPMTLGELLAFSDQATYYSTVTLICRAKTLKQESFIFSSDCIDNARKALQAHEICMRVTQPNPHYRSIYLNW